MEMLKKHQKQTLVILCITALAVSMLAGCSHKQNAKKSPAKNTRKTLVSQEDTTANLGRWGRAMGSVLIAINEGDVYYFGGYEQTEGNKKASARILKQSWGITNRVELLSQIQNLLTTGDRKAYRKEAKEMKKMPKKQLETALKQLSGDTLTHYTMVQYNWKQWKKKGLLAWDMCRVSHLAQWGYVAGYITIEESQALIEPAAQKIADNFDNWDDVQQNWLDGYALYASIDAEHPTGTDYEVRQKKYEELKGAQNGESKLYDDSLFTTGILPLSGISADTILAEAAAVEKDSKKDEKDNKKADKNKDADDNSDTDTTKEPEVTTAPGIAEDNDGIDANHKKTAEKDKKKQ